MSQKRVPSPSQNHKPTKPLWTSQEIQHATQGEICGEFNAINVVIDSRDVSGGELFVALKGPHFDGHDYVKEALEAGAAGALVTHLPEGLSDDSPVIIVPDVLVALNDLAVAARRRSQAKIIGITGSFGKTSLKEVLRHTLEKEGYTLATERSFNNHWGLPLTVSRLHPEHKYAVIEMGMNNPGEISEHSQLAKPHIAVITNTGDAHIGKMGTVQDIAKAKAEIFKGMEQGRLVVLNRSDPFYFFYREQLERRNISIIDFGYHHGALFDFHCENPQKGDDGFKYGVVHFDEMTEVSLKSFAFHWGMNLATLAACLFGLNLDWKKACTSLEGFCIPQGRGNIIEAKSDLAILDESYNAAPTTMEHGIKSLTEMGKVRGKRTIAILGDMLELGQDSARYHENVMKALGFETISKVYCCGAEMKHLYGVLPDSQKGGYALESQDLIATVLADAKAGDIYLVKGSRGQWAARGRMSPFVDALENHQINSFKSEDS